MPYTTKLRRSTAHSETTSVSFAAEVLECRVMLAADMLVSVFDDTNGLSVLRYDDQFAPVAGGVATGPTVGMVQGVAVAPDGTFYVSSLFAGGVLHYDNDGNLLGTLGAGDATPAPFQAPAALAFGPNGHLYVADLQSAAIFQFDTTSLTQQYLAAETLQLTYAPGGFDFEADGDIIVGDLFFQGLNRYDDDNNLTVLVDQGAGFNPAAVLVRPDGDILIGDITFGQDPLAHHQVLLYDVSEDTFSQFINLTTPVGTGSSEGYPPQPSALAFAENGDLLVGLSPDHNLNGAIQRYNPTTGAFIETLVSGIGTPTGIAFLPVDEPAVIMPGRHLFYNDSKFDGNTAGASASDDNAIATDKVPLQFSGSTTAPISAFSSYSKGINGIMIDIGGSHGTITAADFTFKVGTTSTVADWANAPAPLSVSVRPGQGVGGSDRITIIWANNVIQDTWLQVIIEGNDSLGGFNTNTNLANSDVFFFGNRIGDTFISSPPTIVSTTAGDALAVRNHPGILQPVTNVYDFNKDGNVSAGDELIARFNPGILTRNLTWTPLGDPVVAESDDSLSAVASALTIQIVSAPLVEPLTASPSAASAPPSAAVNAAIASLILEPAQFDLLVAAEAEEEDEELDLTL